MFRTYSYFEKLNTKGLVQKEQNDFRLIQQRNKKLTAT